MAEALRILREVFGHEHFVHLQAQVIDSVLSNHHTLALMPTGSGKSLCYQIPALMKEGLAIIVSPLIALMDDQVIALQKIGVAAEALHAGTAFHVAEYVMQQIVERRLKLLYVAPERVVLPNFLNFLARQNVSLFAIDEAHCISQWGHDFRPEYQKLHVLAERFPDVPRIALTATADATMRNEIVEGLKLDPCAVFLGGFARHNLHYRAIEKNDGKRQLLQFIVDEMSQQNGIVYCFSRKRATDTADFLRQNGVHALVYHAGLSTRERYAVAERFSTENGLVLVATVAFGMGVDKANVRFVAHLDMPPSIEHFHQESGRAGRDGLPAISWLCYGLNDWAMQAFRIHASDKTPAQKALAQQKLDAMLQVCESTECRQLALLRYFGEAAQPCGLCDNCRQPPATYDATEDVQKLLSCVYRAGQCFAAGHVIRILRGQADEAVKLHRHHVLPTFGLGRHLSAKQWRALVRQSIAYGYLHMLHDECQSLRLSVSALPVLRGEVAVRFRRPV